MSLQSHCIRATASYNIYLLASCVPCPMCPKDKYIDCFWHEIQVYTLYRQGIFFYYFFIFTEPIELTTRTALGHKDLLPSKLADGWDYEIVGTEKQSRHISTCKGRRLWNSPGSMHFLQWLDICSGGEAGYNEILTFKPNLTLRSIAPRQYGSKPRCFAPLVQIWWA